MPGAGSYTTNLNSEIPDREMKVFLFYSVRNTKKIKKGKKKLHHPQASDFHFNLLVYDIFSLLKKVCISIENGYQGKTLLLTHLAVAVVVLLNSYPYTVF